MMGSRGMGNINPAKSPKARSKPVKPKSMVKPPSVKLPRPMYGGGSCGTKR